MESVILNDRLNRKILLFSHLFFILSLVYGPGAGLAQSQARIQNSLEDKNVLILNALEPNIPAFEKTDHGLSVVLQSGGVSIKNQFYEHLDLRRNGSPETKRLMLELLRQRYGERKIDFIITLYPEALNFLLNECQNIFPGVPVLALYLPQGFKLKKTDRKIIRHSVIPDFHSTIELALKLAPGSRRVYVAGGTHPLDKWLENLMRQDAENWEGRLEFRYLTDLPLEEILSIVAKAPADAIVFITVFSREVTGKPRTTVEVSRMLARISRVPIFGFLDILLGNGIVGGSLMSLEYVGTMAGEMALEILLGKRPAENIPIAMEVPQLPMFDWRELDRWNLNESVLPKESIIINREFSLWDLKYYALGALTFIVVQSLLIAWLLAQRRRRKSAEERVKEQLQFETLLSEVSAGFVNVPAERLDSVIQDAQRRICEFLEVDLSALWQLSVENPDTMYLTHLFRPLGGPQVPERMEAKEYFPWNLQQLKAGKVIAISTEEAPKEAARDQEVWRHYGIKSLLNFPLSVGGDLLIGVLTFAAMREERTWPEPLVKQLQLIARVFADAIARKRADHELHESAVRLSLATDAAGAGLWIMDLDTTRVWVSEKTRELFHFRADEILTYNNFFERIHPDDHEGVKRAMQEALQTGKELKCDYRIILPNGDIRWIVANGRRYPETNPTRLMGASVDITQRKEMEESVRKAAEEWQATFDSIPHVVMILDRDLKILRYNAAAASLFKRPPIEIDGRHCHHLMHGKNGPPEDCPVKRSLRLRNHQENEIYDAERKAWYQVSSDPILDGDGRITRVVHGIKDITGRVEMEEKARRQWEALAHVTRIGSMGELTTSLAHEIIQPLTAIQSNTEAAQRFLSGSAPDLNEVRQILEDIVRNNLRAGSIVKKIRALSKKETTPFVVLDVNDLIQDARSLVRTDSLLAGLVIVEELQPVQPVLGDRTQLQQVIINLILNAAASMRDMPPGQRKLVIRTEEHTESTVKVSAIDSGAGIHTPRVEDIFEPFYTTKPNGMGMGLAISRTIITEHGGTIAGSNSPEGGAVFAFTLPVYQGDQL